MDRRQFVTRMGMSFIGFQLASFKQLYASEWDNLKSLLGEDAEVYTPLDINLETAAQTFKVYNARLDLSSPDIIVCPKSIKAVQETILWAQKNQFKIKMKCGGHSYEGFSTGPGVVIHSKFFQDFHFDSNHQEAKIGSGHLLHQVIEKLAKFNQAIPTGTCPSVGVSGLTQGGGVGMSTRKWGLTCDSLLSADIILADGRFETVNKDYLPEIFWAIQGGGGGNFGFITNFRFKTYQTSQTLAFIQKVQTDSPEKIILAWQDYFKDQAPNEVTSLISIKNDSVVLIGQILPKENGGSLDLNQAYSELGLLQEFIPKEKLRFKNSYLDSVFTFDGNEEKNPAPVRFKAKSHYSIHGLNSEGIQALDEQIKRDPKTGIIFDSLGGQVRERSSQDSAFAHRDALYSVQYYSQWSSQALDKSRISSMNQTYEVMEEYFDHKAYINYCDYDLNNWAERYYGEQLSELLRIKREFDPKNLFDFGRHSLAALA